jgi:hypothetical protein
MLACSLEAMANAQPDGLKSKIVAVHNVHLAMFCRAPRTLVKTKAKVNSTGMHAEDCNSRTTRGCLTPCLTAWIAQAELFGTLYVVV